MQEADSLLCQFDSVADLLIREAVGESLEVTMVEGCSVLITMVHVSPFVYLLPCCVHLLKKGVVDA